jgi:hypothetical protein
MPNSQSEHLQNRAGWAFMPWETLLGITVAEIAAVLTAVLTFAAACAEHVVYVCNVTGS